MKELLFEYDMHLDFAPPVEEHRFTLKCIPQTDQRQLIRQLDVEVYPKEFLSTDEDSFGNYSIYGYTKGKHDRFFARVRGRALTGLAPYLPAKAAHQVGLFRYQTVYTRPGPAILRFAEQFTEAMAEYDAACAADTVKNTCAEDLGLSAMPGTAVSNKDTANSPCAEGFHSPDETSAAPPGARSFSPAVRNPEMKNSDSGRNYPCENISTDSSQSPALSLAVTLMHGLYENFSYAKGVTTISTTAEEAMALGKGVCQDYAHILLSLCRLKKIPCRYVVGRLIGEGDSRAWV
ncbi:MAG: transglutaminase family protein [Lachnospiraceae bacterium]|nr:transglutaminase family protein [Lachnospiraceae bacterium]